MSKPPTLCKACGADLTRSASVASHGVPTRLKVDGKPELPPGEDELECAERGESIDYHIATAPCPSVRITLTATERDAVLAALRLFQRRRKRLQQGIAEIATNGGAHPALENDEIDELCERINFS